MGKREEKGSGHCPRQMGLSDGEIPLKIPKETANNPRNLTDLKSPVLYIDARAPAILRSKLGHFTQAQAAA